jgi:methylated-DNA-[protein]-cysteine S-methyltransferase
MTNYEEIAVSCYESPVGRLVVKANEDFLTGLKFVEEEERFEIPSSNFISKKQELVFQKCIKQLDEYFSGQRKKFDIPFKQNGTEFQQQVWGSLLKIPFGRTISYLQLSKNIGNEKSIRAVGTANGRNNLAIIVPCHRVIGSDGSLTGYAGGLWRKQWLLEHENKFENGVNLLF